MLTRTLKIAFAGFLTLFAFASFAGNLDQYPEIREALNNDRLTLYCYHACLDEGHTLDEVEVQPLYYLIAPDGEHKEADVYITTSKTVGLTTERVVIHVEINDDGDGNLNCGTMNIERETE